MQLPSDWHLELKVELASPYFAELTRFVEAERVEHQDCIFPPESQVFRALELTPLARVRVLILGQDPYPTRGHAHGLAFSVLPVVKPLPASLRNIFKERHSDLGLPVPVCGSLVPWAESGVLLLNSVLTVREGQANSHQNRGWERFTDAIISLVSAQSQHVVFVLWGKSAQKKEPLIDSSRHSILKSAHPSPLSANTGFLGSRPFSKINATLREHASEEIDWRL
jgi:uracil-DNA glycosylase